MRAAATGTAERGAAFRVLPRRKASEPVGREHFAQPATRPAFAHTPVAPFVATNMGNPGEPRRAVPGTQQGGGVNGSAGRRA
jgi:hypothetical protein